MRYRIVASVHNVRAASVSCACGEVTIPQQVALRHAAFIELAGHDGNAVANAAYCSLERHRPWLLRGSRPCVARAAVRRCKVRRRRCTRPVWRRPLRRRCGSLRSATRATMQSAGQRRKFIVDTDAGVDDAGTHHSSALPCRRPLTPTSRHHVAPKYSAEHAY